MILIIIMISLGKAIIIVYCKHITHGRTHAHTHTRTLVPSVLSDETNC